MMIMSNGSRLGSGAHLGHHVRPGMQAPTMRSIFYSNVTDLCHKFCGRNDLCLYAVLLRPGLFNVHRSHHLDARSRLCGALTQKAKYVEPAVRIVYN
ncbi:hypothetical protein KIN20_001710 [Parelaphostrongylus tenuis]|uniref:Uncharacterized protein n=1 Tax=Parelaphostrongylus tenuis TaxID=148309 RepID=A0AAD5QEU4_PARTN|nr:hypothetical protein KIN20_001710 [Parelaphostrongylus tenuis]